MLNINNIYKYLSIFGYAILCSYALLVCQFFSLSLSMSSIILYTELISTKYINLLISNVSKSGDCINRMRMIDES